MMMASQMLVRETEEIRKKKKTEKKKKSSLGMRKMQPIIDILKKKDNDMCRKRGILIRKRPGGKAKEQEEKRKHLHYREVISTLLYSQT